MTNFRKSKNISVENRYELVLSRHCHCRLFLASEKSTTMTCRKALAHTVARGWARVDLSKWAACMARTACTRTCSAHVQCPYKRAAHALRSSLYLPLLFAALLLASILAGASTPAQRLSRPDIAGHRQICGDGN